MMETPVVEEKVVEEKGVDLVKEEEKVTKRGSTIVWGEYVNCVLSPVCEAARERK